MTRPFAHLTKSVHAVQEVWYEGAEMRESEKLLNEGISDGVILYPHNEEP
jgi:hypothetical protein